MRAGTMLLNVSHVWGEGPSSRYCATTLQHWGTSCKELQEGLVRLMMKQLLKFLIEQYKTMPMGQTQS